MGNQGGNVGNLGGNDGNQGRNTGNQRGNDGNRGRNAGNQGGMQRTRGGNEGNKGENLRIGVELINYNCGKEQQTRNCVFLVIV